MQNGDGCGKKEKNRHSSQDSLSDHCPTAVRLTKELMKDLPGLSLEKGLIAALQLNTLIRTTEDFKEGISSFLEKRRAQWKRR